MNLKDKITVDPHYSTNFYAELWAVSRSTVLRWFQDHPGVLKFSEGSDNGKGSRRELRIPLSVAQAEYDRRCKG